LARESEQAPKQLVRQPARRKSRWASLGWLQRWLQLLIIANGAANRFELGVRYVRLLEQMSDESAGRTFKHAAQQIADGLAKRCFALHGRVIDERPALWLAPQ